VIVPFTAEHWEPAKLIFEQGLTTGKATFETSSPSWETWDAAHLAIGRFVALENNLVVGWVALSPVSSRCVYGGVAEISVYIHEDHRGKGLGKLLLAQVIATSEANGYWTLQAGIMPTNLGSIKLHEAMGFRKIGYRERVSKINNVWTDNLLFEKRSAVVGTE